MKFKLLALSIAATTALAAGCNTTGNTNTAHGNSNTAAVVNANQAPIVNGSVTNMASNVASNVAGATNVSGNARSSINYNGTAKENEAQRTSIEAQARTAGGKIGQGAEDWWLWSKTNAALTAETSLAGEGINVDVDNGVITLRGNVANKENLQKADQIGKSITGKKSFQNQLKVGGDASSGAPAKKG